MNFLLNHLMVGEGIMSGDNKSFGKYRKDKVGERTGVGKGGSLKR